MHIYLLSVSYPFTISHNHLINLGSPHAWPIVLGSVMWLAEVSELGDRRDVGVRLWRDCGIGGASERRWGIREEELEGIVMVRELTWYVWRCDQRCGGVARDVQVWPEVWPEVWGCGQGMLHPFLLLQLCSLTHDPTKIIFIREDGFDESADKVGTFFTHHWPH